MNVDRKVILAIGAHPDDIEFACGGTITKMVREGAKAYFIICTLGNRGSRLQKVTRDSLIKDRKLEQEQASKILGAHKTIFLDHEDGNLEANISFKEEIVKIIRQVKPDVVITHDPSWFYKIGQDTSWINHNDHRECGKAVLDAVYPLARDTLSFEEHLSEGLTPHQIHEVLLFNFDNPNYAVDISEFVQTKIDSIRAHKSQIDNEGEMEEWVLKRLTEVGKKFKFKYAEGFTRLILE